MDLITFHALKGEQAAGYRMWVLLATQTGVNEWNAEMEEQTWCRGCAIVEAFFVSSPMSLNWQGRERSSALLPTLVGNDSPLPSIVRLLPRGMCAKCKKWFGTFPALVMNVPAQRDRFAHDTWRKRNRGKIR